MTKTPGEGPGSSSYRRPGLALGIAAIAYALMVVLLSTYPALVSWPPALRRLVDLVVLSAPLVAAVVVAGRLAADGIGRATGIRLWKWTDAVLGVLVALVVRAIVELVAPTTGSLFGPFETNPDAIATVVLVIGLVLVTPLIEELFFRGLVQRATQDHLGRSAIASVVAVLVSTAAFTLLHVIPYAAAVPVGLLVSALGVGLGCGILTIVTGRLGAAITAHVVFNAIGVALLLF